MSSFDQIAKFLVKQCEQQALDVQPIHIGICGNDDSMELQATDIKGIAGTGTQHIDDRAYLFILDDTLQLSSSDIQRFPFELEHRLKL